MKYILSILIIGLVVSACSFNKIYLHPNKIPAGTQQTASVDYFTRDTLYINIGDKHQPTFFIQNNVPVDLPYQIESVLFENEANSHLLNGWIISPNSNPNGKSILFLHGNAGNLFSQYQFAAPFAERGFEVFIFDYSGFGFSEGKATRNNVLKDANAAFEYLAARNEGKNMPLIIYGQSLGGHLSAVLAAQHHDEVDALVMEGAFSSHDDIAEEKAGFFGRMMVAEKYSAIESIKDFHKPVLIIHSNEDKTIPFDHGVRLYKAANEPKAFYEIDQYHIRGPIYYADSIVFKMNSMLN